MIYIFLNNNYIKTLYFKKSLMGQFETFFFEKKYQINIINEDSSFNIDILASVIKEALNEISTKEKRLYIILPQELFLFLKIKVPIDIAPSALKSFINDKVINEWKINPDDFYTDYLTFKNNSHLFINLYTIKRETVTSVKKTLNLINCRLINIIPETIAYFKLFSKTLRKGKEEKILFLRMENNQVEGFQYDNNGLIEGNRLFLKIDKTKSLETQIKNLLDTFSYKPNRLIISGNQSEDIRQDIFTKMVGVWTNPLKRIINDFYKDQVKLLIFNQKEKISLLNYDICFGAFIFDLENKNFSLIKNGKLMINHKKINITFPSFNLNFILKKNFLFFIISFIMSFGFFMFLSKLTYNKNFQFFSNKISKPTITPTPTYTITPSPTPTYSKTDLKIKILNGSGIKGKAAELRDILKEKNYGEILTGNADNFDYKRTIIKTKRTYQEAGNLLKQDLQIENPKFELLPEDNPADIEIIIGQDIE